MLASDVIFRPLRPGDIGHIIRAQALLYWNEYQWNIEFEGLLARIMGEYIEKFDPALDDAWVAEMNCEIVGSIFLVRSGVPKLAKLRLLYVEEKARGHKIGYRLIEMCINRARELGYEKMTLWTNSILPKARSLYEAFGSKLIDENRETAFGHDLVFQNWDLEL